MLQILIEGKYTLFLSHSTKNIENIFFDLHFDLVDLVIIRHEIRFRRRRGFELGFRCSEGLR